MSARKGEEGYSVMILRRISQYLQLGGFFNPELMNHDKVRDMIIDCRSHIESLERKIKKIQRVATIAERKRCIDIAKNHMAGTSIEGHDIAKKIEESETSSEQLFYVLEKEDIHPMWAALIAMVDEIHAPQDNLSDEQWDIAEAIRNDLDAIMNK